MSSVTDDGDLNFGVVWKLLCFTGLCGLHRDLHASRKGGIFFCCTNISIFQAWSHWVHVEEWILSVFNVCHWLVVQTLMALVANSRQVKKGTPLLSFDALESIIQNYQRK